MRTTNEILDAAKTALHADSDYRLAKELETTTGHVTNWRAKKSQPNNEMVYRLATMLAEDPALLLAEIEADFARTPERAGYWLNFLRSGGPQAMERRRRYDLRTGSGTSALDAEATGEPHKMRLCRTEGYGRSSKRRSTRSRRWDRRSNVA